MGIVDNALIGASGQGGYFLSRSVRLRASASAYLSRTPASTGNRKTFTWSGWVKRGALGINGTLFANGNGVSANGYFTIRFNTNDTISIFNDNDGTLTTCDWSFTNVFRDVAAWYHLILAIDTTQATQTNRLKLYVNGVQNTNNSVVTYPAQNSDFNINRTVPHQIGQFGFGSSQYFDGYLTEVNFIDGQALTPSSFGSTNTLTGVWQPARYTGTYGTNGFYLPFTDNSALTTSSNAGLGKDFSGNGNYWATNNISITSGTTYDSMTDVPTLTSATAANFAVLNPLKNYNNTIADGNLTISSTSSSTTTIVLATIGMSSGKWYWEFTQTSYTVINSPMIGVAKDNVSMTAYVGSDANGWGYYGANGEKYNNGSGTAYGASYTNNDVMGVAFDADAGTLVFYKNNVSQGTAFTGLTSGPYFPAFSDGGSTAVMTANVNFGQRPFSYTPPTGYVALNTFNLPTGTILKGNTVMDATTYTGNATAGTNIANAAAFKPDFVWIKNRTNATNHILTDSVRGATKTLFSDLTNAETTVTGGLTAFNSNGFQLGFDGSNITNNTANNYVGWQWQAGQGTTSTNTNGTITSTVSVNASAGFSVVTYTGTGSNATIGHGLGVAPSMIISKSRNNAGGDAGFWDVYHVGLTSAAYFLKLNTTDAQASAPTVWNSTAPTSSVYSIGTASGTNAGSGATYVAYCFAPIAGYSAFGSYTGNGSNDGPFVYVGFRPKFVMIKRTDSTGLWYINDSSRDTYNVVGLDLSPNSSAAESNDSPVQDFLSNGFKLRNGSYPSFNANGGTYIYAAFAESPFKNSLAR